jgi:hypothetical protein
MVPVIAAITASTVAAAALKRRNEEEQMAQYRSDDLDGWEFKIVRSAMGRFSNRAFMKKICREEAQAGWELVEKFDDYRIRFKRRVEKRSVDPHLSVDPYRTAVSVGSKSVVWVVVGLALLLAGVAILLIRMNGGG